MPERFVEQLRQPFRNFFSFELCDRFHVRRKIRFIIEIIAVIFKNDALDGWNVVVARNLPRTRGAQQLGDRSFMGDADDRPPGTDIFEDFPRDDLLAPAYSSTINRSASDPIRCAMLSE